MCTGWCCGSSVHPCVLCSRGLRRPSGLVNVWIVAAWTTSALSSGLTTHGLCSARVSSLFVEFRWVFLPVEHFFLVYLNKEGFYLPSAPPASTSGSASTRTTLHNTFPVRCDLCFLSCDHSTEKICHNLYHVSPYTAPKTTHMIYTIHICTQATYLSK